ncbi:MAG TPA: TIGR02206 family membrane protein [Pseudonocardia sp.]|nr:TIGR02206 family membrane protein [Pseudonocardia sp.]
MEPMARAAGEFTAYGPSHWAVLAVTVLGATGLVLFGRHGDARLVERCCQVGAVLILVLNVGMEIAALRFDQLVHTLPLQLSDLAPYVSAYALWTRRPLAFALTFFWCLTLSTQALLTPVLSGPDFPSESFLAFFTIHVLVIWAAIFLAWGVGLRPDWRGYGFTVLVTVCWAAVMIVFNAVAGTNYGFLNAKPPTETVLNALGPWPWYLLPETALVVGGWAVLTLVCRRRADSTVGAGQPG